MQTVNQAISSPITIPPLADSSNIACKERILRKSNSFVHCLEQEVKRNALSRQAEDRTYRYDGYSRGHERPTQATALPSQVNSAGCA